LRRFSGDRRPTATPLSLAIGRRNTLHGRAIPVVFDHRDDRLAFNRHGSIKLGHILDRKTSLCRLFPCQRSFGLLSETRRDVLSFETHHRPPRFFTGGDKTDKFIL
jgi:hypothetical protein